MGLKKIEMIGATGYKGSLIRSIVDAAVNHEKNITKLHLNLSN
ncbi:hypothetical protein bcere0009_8840 [Bacillus cereus R309803]|nr:hypothetical protein bcere0009_8840 [Bacillus cereus R309803]